MMTMLETDGAIAERLAHRRANLARVMAMLLVATEIGAWHSGSDADAAGALSQAAGFLWCAVLFAFAAGGGLMRNARVRALMSDEGTNDHRRRAFSLGFWVALASCGALWVLALSVSFTAAAALRIVVTASVAVALLRFATLEKKSLKDG